MPRDHRRPPAEKPLRGRFYFLIASILLLLAVSPFIEGYRALSFITDVFWGFVFLSIVYAVSDYQKNLIVGALLVLPLLFSMVSKYWVTTPFFDQLASLGGAAFIAFSLYAIARYVARQEAVNPDVIGAAIVFYLLMGVMWSIVFKALEYFEPGSFSMGDEHFATNNKTRFIYYSFVTLTTLGYGDITPLTARACSLSIIEAIVGQLYLVIQVAWLVGMHISKTMEEKAHKTDEEDRHLRP